MRAWDAESDEALLGASRSDSAAFAAFYRRFEERMLRFFLSRVGDAEVAADLTAETFAAALAGAHRHRPDKGPAIAWLYGIARNLLAMSARRGLVCAASPRPESPWRRPSRSRSSRSPGAATIAARRA
jgi:DNA-directed RNA polymerase specialized sigma24 family protein